MPLTQPCRSCGAPIVWIRLESGRSAPCDPKPVVIHTASGVTLSGYGSHFATCPNATQHRKRKPVAPMATEPIEIGAEDLCPE